MHVAIDFSLSFGVRLVPKQLPSWNVFTYMNILPNIYGGLEWEDCNVIFFNAFKTYLIDQIKLIKIDCNVVDCVFKGYSRYVKLVEKSKMVDG